MKIDKYTAPSWLVPSYVVHRGPFSCKSDNKQAMRLCYHPAIRIGPMVAGEIIWASDSCYRRDRGAAVAAAAFELKNTRKRRCWPNHWRRPPGGDRQFLFELPQSEERITLRKTREYRQLEEEARKVVREIRGEKETKAVSIHDILSGQSRMSDVQPAIEPPPAPTEKISLEAQKALDKESLRTYDPSVMFETDEPKPEQNAGADPATAKKGR